MNGECVICRKPLDNPSVDHLFPYAIGGRKEIGGVCVSCNNKMGEKVDSKLTDYLFVLLFRERFHLTGKNGKAPSFF